jgi:hypothetical protein
MHSVLSAAGLWALYVVVFALAGGIAAGIMAWAFELLTATGFTDTLYSVCFGVTGYIAYRLARDTVEARALLAAQQRHAPPPRRPVDTGKPLV